jgi:hypothetical protein
MKRAHAQEEPDGSASPDGGKRARADPDDPILGGEGTAFQVQNMDPKLRVGRAIEDTDNYVQPPAAQNGTVPELPFRWMFSGPSHAGKSNAARFIIDNHYPGVFQRIYLFSRTAKVDPTWKNLPSLRLSDRIVALDKTSAPVLKSILDRGVRRVKAMGKAHAPYELIIIDDAIAATKFMNSEAFLDVFIRCRHGNISLMILTQSYMKVPRSARLQLSALAAFPSRSTELERLFKEHGAFGMSKQEFIQMATHASRITPDNLYPFFYVDCKKPTNERFRRGLDIKLIPRCELLGKASDEALQGEAARYQNQRTH